MARARHRIESLAPAFVAAATAGAVLLAVPPHGDAPTHLYRSSLVRDGIFLWDNHWFAGHYPIASSGPLYYLLAAAVGNRLLVAAAAVASAWLFASVAQRQWGDAARIPALAFALLAPGPLITGTYPYAVGIATLLGTLRLIQAQRDGLALAAAAVTLGCSPVAFAVLCIVLVAAAAQGRVRLFPLAIGVVMLAALQLPLLELFPVGGRQQFPPLQLGALLAVCALGAALALRAGSRVLTAFFAVWALAGLAAFLVPTPLGVNVTRPRFLVFPLLLVAASLARFRPFVLAAPALAVALAYNLGPYPARIDAARGAVSRDAEFWDPIIAFLERRSGPRYRVEVVPTAAHWEAHYLPRAGIAIARGWQRQLDVAESGALYSDTLGAAEYRAWLRRVGVRYVVLPELALDRRASTSEAALLRSGRSGLRGVAGGPGWTIYELPHATPLLTGPSPAGVTDLDHRRVTGWTARSGRFRLRVHYTPYWRVEAGAVSLARTPDGMTLLEAHRPGQFTLAV